ncbi:YfhO family protein [Lacticaseibacillus pantheris]|uniref:YfhO family protein n=1 Tax=Lacticaseibacillus pantheris TaxID=171523 RepID=UPI00265ABAFA|nr:YfhO family protein [Lacticaseibacillus pantheris]WKF84758.1 YfhO family protein [Lacticaseibacillus pantheris]
MKTKKLGKKSNKIFYVYLILALIIPFTFILVIFWALHIYPFGNNTVITVDFSNQFLALFSYLQEILSGHASVTYSTSMGLGGNFFGVLTYYLMSPFNLLVVFFSKSQLPYFASLITILKISFIGLTMFVYLTKARLIRGRVTGVAEKTIFKAALIFSSSFALMAYVFAYKECIMWLDAIILMPLIFLGMDKIIFDHKVSLFTVTLTAAIITNFYFGYIIGMFSGLIMLMLLMSPTLKTENKRFRILRQYAFGGTVSLMLSAFVTIPSYKSTLGVAKNSQFSYQPVYSASNFVVQLFRDNQVANNGLRAPIIFFGLVGLALSITFFMSNRIRFSDKLIAAVTLLFLFVSSWLDVLYLVWHAMAWPNGYYQRQAFLIPFVLCVLGFIGLLSLYLEKPQRAKEILISAFVIFLAVAGVATSGSSLKYIIFAIGISGATYAIALVTLRKYRDVGIVGILVVALLSLGVVDYRIEATITGQSLKTDDYQYFYRTTRELLDRTKLDGKTFARVGNRYQANDNDPILFGYNGISNYLSQQSTAITDFLSANGYYQKHTWKRWANYNNGSTLSMDRLLGVKYTYGSVSPRLSRAIPGVNATMSGDNSTFNVPKSNKIRVSWKEQEYSTTDSVAFPLAFRANSKKLTHSNQIRYDTMNDPFLAQNNVWRQLDSSIRMFTKQESTVNSRGEYTVRVNKSGNIYLFVPTNRGFEPMPVDVHVNGKLRGQMFVNDTENGIFYLGRYSAGSTIKVGFSKHGFTEINSKNVENAPIIVSESNTEYLRAYRSMVDGSVYKSVVHGSKVSFDTGSKFREGNVVVSLPYDSNWYAFIDGHPVHVKRALTELMTVKVPDGRHKVVMRYKVPGLTIGILISSAGVLLFVISGILNVWYRRKNI